MNPKVIQVEPVSTSMRWTGGSFRENEVAPLGSRDMPQVRTRFLTRSFSNSLLRSGRYLPPYPCRRSPHRRATRLGFSGGELSGLGAHDYQKIIGSAEAPHAFVLSACWNGDEYVGRPERNPAFDQQESFTRKRVQILAYNHSNLPLG